MKLLFFAIAFMLLCQNKVWGQQSIDESRVPITSQDLSAEVLGTAWQSDKHYVIISRAKFAQLEKEAYFAYKRRSRNTPYKSEQALFRSIATENYLDSLQNPTRRKSLSARSDKELKIINPLYEEMRIDREYAVVNKPDWGLAHAEYGMWLAQHGGSRERGIEEMRKGIRLSPLDARCSTMLADVLSLRSGSEEGFPEAIRLYENAARLKPDYAAPYWGLCLTYLRMRKIEKAKSAYNKFIERIPKDEAKSESMQSLKDAIQKSR